ncbi:hypothetical protein Clacol_009772 [Clathrus columnatus]|uniref:Uncharacterized protein n=1 Tax=Clathrus columnatus TaxID=1419009 RepID=A0AAV5ALJ7_9AGAM|nr:hypothetical protein Clacol_009772 [Clathrus columnatus]
MDEIFLNSKSKFDKLHMFEGKHEEDSDSEDDNKKEREKQLTEHLEKVFNRICQSITNIDSRQYNRNWISTAAAKKLRSEKNTPTIKSRREELEIL